MNDLLAFEKRAAKARRDGPPPINVTDQVLARLQHHAQPSALKSPFVQMSAASALAAGVALAATVPVWTTWYDPMVRFLIALSL